MTHLFALAVLTLPHLDQHGDPLPPGAVARFGTVRFRVGSDRARSSHALSPDGKYLAVEGRDGIKLWDTDTGRVAKHLPWRTWQGSNPRFALCFSPDGKRLARLAGRVVAVWDLTSGKEVFDIDFKEEGEFQAIAFVAGGDRLVVATRRATVATLDARTGRVLAEPAMDQLVHWVSPSARRYLSLTDSVLSVIDADSGKQICQIKDLKGPFDSPPTLSPDDRRLYLADRSGRLRVFDAATGKVLEDLTAPASWEDAGWPTELGVAPDGSVAYLTKHGQPTRRRDLKAGKWLAPLPVSSGGTVLPAPDGRRLLLLGHDGALHPYDLTTLTELPSGDGFTDSVFAFPSPDGKRVVVESGSPWVRSRLDLFDIAGKPLWSVRPGEDWGMPTWSPDGRWLACVASNRIVLRAANTGKAVRTIQLAKDEQRHTTVVQFSPDSDRLILSDLTDRPPITVDRESGKRTTFRLGDRRGERSVSADGRVRVEGRDGPGVQLVDLDSGKVVVGWTDPEERGQGYVNGPEFSPDGSYVLSWDLEPQREAWRSRDLMAVVRDPVTLARRHSFGVRFSGIFESAISPNGLWLAAGDYSGRLRVWDVPTGEQIASWEGHHDHVSSLAFVGRGRLLTASADLTALVWDLRPSGRPAIPVWEALSGHDAREAWRAVWALAADPRAPEFLRSKVRVAVAPPAEKVRQWLADLGADRYAVREAAAKELQAIGRLAEPDLRVAQERATSAEVRTRIEAILAKVPRGRSWDEVVQGRAVAAMELAGSTAARKLLAEWAGGAPGARLTTDAKAALARAAGR